MHLLFFSFHFLRMIVYHAFTYYNTIEFEFLTFDLTNLFDQECYFQRNNGTAKCIIINMLYKFIEI